MGGGHACGYECKKERERKRACKYEYSYCMLHYTTIKDRSDDVGETGTRSYHTILHLHLQYTFCILFYEIVFIRPQDESVDKIAKNETI